METTDLSALLPDDVLVDVLRCLARRDLAASRCVCKRWCAVVDADPLLHQELLRLPLAGFLINFHNYYLTEFFSRPSATGPSITGKRHYLPKGHKASWSTVLDHCNGLLLVDSYYHGNTRTLFVLNPATRRYAPLPPSPPWRMEMFAFEEEYLAYDPAISPHYEVFLIPCFRWEKLKPKELDHMDKLDLAIVEQSEWPPSTYILDVFSSLSGRWDERSFIREGDAAGDVADMMKDWPGDQRNAVYWRGTLYVHCQTNFVMRISLSTDRYQVIKLPVDIEKGGYPQFYLGKSEEGVYCATIQGRCRLRVWVLNDSSCTMEWVLKHDRDLLEWLLKNKLSEKYHNYGRQARGHWILEDINYYYHKYDNTKKLVEEEFDWSSEASDDEKFKWNLDTQDKDRYHGYIDILGFHPYKEIVFLSESITRALAYHLNSSKLEELGNLYPRGYDDELPNEQFITSSFPYTPCWMEHSADGDNSSEASDEDNFSSEASDGDIFSSEASDGDNSEGRLGS